MSSKTNKPTSHPPRSGSIDVVALCSAVVLVSVACATPDHVSFTRVNSAPRPLNRRAPETVEVYVVSTPARPHTSIGLFEVSQGTDGVTPHSTAHMLASLRTHAALRDCDAIVLLGINAISHHHHDHKRIQASCMIFTDDDAVKAARQGPQVRLKGEGSPCVVYRSDSCEAPLVCNKGVCGSPYEGR